MNILSEVNKFSSTQITSSDTFKDFFGEFLKYIELSLKTPQSKIDIDNIDDSFIDNYKRIYMSNIPDTNPVKSLNTDEIKRVLNDIVSVNKNKGVIETIEYMFRTLYGEFDVNISSGINSAVVEYKPDDYTVQFVDNNFNPIDDYNFNSLSNQPFSFVNDPTIRGFVVTIFNGNHIWVDKLYGKVSDGDILYFPNINTYVKILETNKLELDGWKDKEKRYKLDYFYAQSKINHKLFSVYKNELYGYDYITNPTINDLEFGNINDGYGKISDLEINYTSGIDDYTHNIDYEILVDGETYSVNIKLQTIDKKTTLKINNKLVDIPISDRIVYRLSAYEFLDSNNTPIVDKDIIDYKISRISFFTYIIETKLKPNQFMDVLRNSVIPAGYNFISVVTVVSDLIDVILGGIIKGDANTPNYNIKYTAPKKIYDSSFQYGKPIRNYRKIFSSKTIRTMSFEDWDRHYKFDLVSSKFFNIDDFNFLKLEFLDTDDYYNKSVYEISTKQTSVNKIIPNNINHQYVIDKKYNVTFNDNITAKYSNNISSKIQYTHQNEHISMSFYDFDKNYKFSKWAETFFTVNDLYDIDINFLESDEYYNDLLYNKITKQTIVNIS